jgi:hypothetical protein
MKCRETPDGRIIVMSGSEALLFAPFRDKVCRSFHVCLAADRGTQAIRQAVVGDAAHENAFGAQSPFGAGGGVRGGKLDEDEIRVAFGHP